MYQCFNCLQDTVCWDCDYDFDDFGCEGEGIVHVCHCTNCGADIEYRVPVDDMDIEELLLRDMGSDDDDDDRAA